jgi:uncharacterized pyridoxamine 5'-phosphate oxidase family protein
MEAIEKVAEFLKASGTYFLATVDQDQPRVRPFGTAELFEGKLYIQTGKSKDVSKQLAVNPKFEISATHNDEWIRVCGVLVEDDRIEPKKNMLDKNPSLRNMYDENDSNTQVLYMKDVTATICSFTKEPEVYTF